MCNAYLTHKQEHSVNKTSVRVIDYSYSSRENLILLHTNKNAKKKFECANGHPSAILLTCIKNWSLKPILGLFESGRCTQVLLYLVDDNIQASKFL